MVVVSTDPLMTLWKRESQMDIIDLPESASHGDETISNDIITQGAGCFACGCGNCIALNIFWKRDRGALIAQGLKPVAALPVGVQNVSVTQVGDPAAANFSESRERCTVGKELQDDIEPVSTSLQECAVMGRS